MPFCLFFATVKKTSELTNLIMNQTFLMLFRFAEKGRQFGWFQFIHNPRFWPWCQHFMSASFSCGPSSGNTKFWVLNGNRITKFCAGFSHFAIYILPNSGYFCFVSDIEYKIVNPKAIQTWIMIGAYIRKMLCNTQSKIRCSLVFNRLFYFKEGKGKMKNKECG